MRHIRPDELGCCEIRRLASIDPDAVADVFGSLSYPDIRGRVWFTQLEVGVYVEAQIENLPQTTDNFFAFHLHSGTCFPVTNSEAFPNAGSHYNPENLPHPRHAGDFPPLLNTSEGLAYLAFVTDRFTVSQAIGRAVIIHLNPDDFTTQPSGNSGEKIACGMVREI